jgi:hypothetical protein
MRIKIRKRILNRYKYFSVVEIRMAKQVGIKFPLGILSFFIVLIFLYVLLNSENLQVNLIVFLTLSRGIISQNCFWWKVNDLVSDATGAEVYTRFKAQGRFVPLNIFGHKMFLLTNIDDIQHLLDLSPNPFGPGTIKRNFFNSFIPQNVGISVNPDWKYKRDYNDKVLETDKVHKYNWIFGESIKTVINRINPKKFEEFTEATRQITSQILFGTYEYNPIIYKVFKQADGFFSAIFKVNTVNENDYNEFREYLKYELENPKPNTLLEIANKHHALLPTDSIIDQIPHWVFPIAGLFSVHLPRLLALLGNHPAELELVNHEIVNKLYYTKDNYIRKCILELFRLNNAVNSTFRGLTEPFTFKDSSIQFEKGTQFVFFNNPVLRDLFDRPNEFIPARWTLELEDTYRALMFNQGNQKCPGKELVLSLLTQGLVAFLELNSMEIRTNTKLEPSFIPYIINPCTIEFA